MNYFSDIGHLLTLMLLATSATSVTPLATRNKKEHAQ